MLGYMLLGFFLGFLLLAVLKGDRGRALLFPKAGPFKESFPLRPARTCIHSPDFGLNLQLEPTC